MNITRTLPQVNKPGRGLQLETNSKNWYLGIS